MPNIFSFRNPQDDTIPKTVDDVNDQDEPVDKAACLDNKEVEKDLVDETIKESSEDRGTPDYLVLVDYKCETPGESNKDSDCII